jgi:hypothetical protein
MSDVLEGLDNDHGGWAVVFYVVGSTGERWGIYPSVGLSRWSSRDIAAGYAARRASRGLRSAVIEWGGDLLTDGRMASCPELVNNPRVREALALDSHVPVLETDAQGALTGALLGCWCGWRVKAHEGHPDDQLAHHVAAALVARKAT